MLISQPLIIDPKWSPAVGDVEKLKKYHLAPDGGKVKLRFSGRKNGSCAKKRTRTFKHMRKILRSSLPSIEAGHIWKAVSSDRKEDEILRCVISVRKAD